MAGSGSGSASKNQIYDTTNGKIAPAVTGQPSSIQYGFQGMRGRLIGMGLPKLKPGGGNNFGIGRQSVMNAKKGL